MQRVGVVGGFGPAATVYFYKKLIQICQTKYKAVQDHEFPPIIIFNFPTYGFDETGITNDRRVRKSLKKEIDLIKKCKVKLIVFDCNTLFIYEDLLRKYAKIPIIGPVDCVSEVVKKGSYKRVGILASETTVKRGIYDSVLSDDVKLIKPTKSQEKIITSLILRIMGKGNNKSDVKKLRKIIGNMKKRGAEAVIIGCTELSIAAENQKFSLPIIDSSNVLAASTIKRAMH